MFRAVFEDAGIGMALVDAGGHPIATNRVLQEMLGYTDEELRATSFTELTHADDRDETIVFADELLRGIIGRYQLDKRYIRKDGGIVHVRLTVSLIHDAEGKPRYGLGMVEDVTALHELSEERRQLRAKLAGAQERERMQVAHEIHEDPVQRLTALALRVESQARVASTDEERAHLRSLAEDLSATIARLRRLMFELLPPNLEREGLAAAVRELLAHTGEGSIGDELDVRLAGEPTVDVGAAAYRIVQEAIRNAHKHSHARRLAVQLTSDDQVLHGNVTDDGRGFDPATASGPEDGHLGLVSMRERAELFGGDLEVDSAPGAGTTVRFTMPLAT